MAEELRADEVQWIWPGRVALGKLTLLAGDPGVGKSMVALDIAARVSRGAEFREVMGETVTECRGSGVVELGGAKDEMIAREAADNLRLYGSRADPFADVRRESRVDSGSAGVAQGSAPMESATSTGSGQAGVGRVKGRVLVYSAEDDWGDTVAPRLRSAGADMGMIERMVAMDKEWEPWQPFSMRKHLSILEAWMQSRDDLRLLILDPITACMDGIDHHSTSAVRVHLAPLVQMAAIHRVAVLGITHFNKRRRALDLHRTTGSMAVAAIARTVHFALPGKDGGPCVLTAVKNNLTGKTVPQAYEVRDGKVEWLGEVKDAPEGAGGELHEEDIYEKHVREMAREFLLEGLAEKPRLGRGLIDRGRRVGISMRTMVRAKAELGVRSKKVGRKGWYWMLPGEGLRG